MTKKYRFVVAFMLVAVLVFSSCSTAGNPGGGEVNTEPENTGLGETAKTGDNWEIIEAAYIFAFPLVILDATAANSTNTAEPTDSQAPVNQLIHSVQLANAETKFVVTPNVDTIYSQVHLDLSEDAIVFKKPAADRFFSVELMDAYTNCVRILGTGGDTQDEKTYLIAGPDFNGSVPDGMELVRVPTNNSWMLMRIMVNDSDDLENVYEIQDAMELTPLSKYGQEFDPPKGTYDEKYDYVPVGHVLSLTPEEFFSKANELMVKNPPTAADQEIVDEMEKISVGAGLTFDADVLGEDASDKWASMINGLTDMLSERITQFVKKMGIWSFSGEPIAEFGTEYDYRALVALGGLGANPVSIAIYPKAAFDSDKHALNGNNSYTLHFDEAPPVNEFGFWSITAYGEDNFLIDNELDRYAITDRSELKYNSDGSLSILIQAEPPEDETMMGNWLPVKAEQVHLYLRVYLPDSRILDGGWTAPDISKN